MESKPSKTIEENWNWLLERLPPREMNALFQVAYRLVQNTDDTDDVMQEALLIAATHLHLLKKPDRFFQWMYAVVHNAAYAYRRNNFIRPQAALARLAEDLPEPLAPTDQQAMQSVDNELLHKLINELPDLSREIVVMHLFHNVNLITVSKVMKLNYQTVRSRYRRALITIKERMEELQYETSRAQDDRGSDQISK